VVEGSFAEGFDWCIEKLKASPFHALASELEIHKALTYLKMKEFRKAIKLLKAFEKKENSMLSTAATNLSFLYFLVGFPFPGCSRRGGATVTPGASGQATAPLLFSWPALSSTHPLFLVL
jgi:hypothetical protein